jgi:hypothetical protein
MKRSLITLTLAAVALSCAAATTRAQTPSAPAAATARASQHLIGEVTALDPAGGQITVKTDAGASVNVTTNEKTVYRRVPPGQTSLAGAETITRADVHAGDRVLVPNGAAASPGPARQVIVMAREAIASKQAQERQDWRARGVRGRVAAIDPAKEEITVETFGRGGVRENFSRGGGPEGGARADAAPRGDGSAPRRPEPEKVTVAADGAGVRFLRYAPGSTSQADAVPGTFADIRVGDEIRVLGNREGSRVTAEQVISGTTTRLAGTVESVDAARSELTVKDAAGKVFTVALGAKATIRRITPEALQQMQQRAEQRRSEAAGQNGQGGTGDGNGPRGGDRAGRGDGEGRRRGFGGGGPGGMFGNLPAITLAELKKGDGVIIMGTPGADAAHVTAASVTAGDQEVLQRMRQGFRRGPGGGQRGAGAGVPGEGGGPERP